ncbi:toll/interleukin-1 receptor domain-containing protein, partial [Phocaeicola massiliensis]
MSSNFKTPLSVYVLYDKDNTKGSETYEKIYHLLCRNSSRPFEDGLDIPVFFRTDMANQIPPIDINFSNKTIAILLVDDNMYCNTIWDEYIKELLVKEDNGALKIFAVKLSKYAFDINPLLQEEQFICLKNENIETDWHEFQIRLYDNILRYLKSYKVGQKLKLFISHSKKDKDHLGESTAISLRDYLRSDTKLDSFFDVNDILDGHQFAQQIQSGIASSLLVIIESDTYSEREWCRIEAISGKKNNVPSILVNVLNGVSSRTFPYLGNMPKIRFNGKWDDVIILLLRTALDQYYEKEYLEQLVMKCDLQNTSILPVPPELMNLINIEDNIKSILYPEPP